MIITKEIEIDMGHTVTLHNSKCRHLHGHRYRINAAVDGNLIQEGSSKGMVIDFTDLKNAMIDIIDKDYDHAFVIWEKDPRACLLEEAHILHHNDINKFHKVNFVPTAENLAQHWFLLLEKELNEKYNINLLSIEVYETPTSSAIFSKDMKNEN